ncbi:hypothetical protein Sjap_023979 [Stephania japonica]|uniref:Uncharacterized protein n=1 Tax=Stephania japonica TaxID=461633 RepID=A0AAP0EFT4_9MAGN
MSLSPMKFFASIITPTSVGSMDNSLAWRSPRKMAGDDEQTHRVGDNVRNVQALRADLTTLTKRFDDFAIEIRQTLAQLVNQNLNGQIETFLDNHFEKLATNKSSDLANPCFGHGSRAKWALLTGPKGPLDPCSLKGEGCPPFSFNQGHEPPVCQLEGGATAPQSTWTSSLVSPPHAALTPATRTLFLSSWVAVILNGSVKEKVICSIDCKMNSSVKEKMQNCYLAGLLVVCTCEFGSIGMAMEAYRYGREPLTRGSSLAEIERASSLATKAGMHFLFQELGNVIAYILDFELASAAHHMKSFN